MKHKRTQVDYLLDILDNVEKAQRFVEGVTQKDFESNDEKVYAVVHALQTIGEAARHVPKSLRQRYAAIDWEDVVGMRDIVIHEYFGVDLDIIWRTIQKDLVPLETLVKKMLSDSGEQGNSDST
jgi:uncharacterized protein with HEPN domain